MLFCFYLICAPIVVHPTVISFNLFFLFCPTSVLSISYKAALSSNPLASLSEKRPCSHVQSMRANHCVRRMLSLFVRQRIVGLDYDWEGWYPWRWKMQLTATPKCICHHKKPPYWLMKAQQLAMQWKVKWGSIYFGKVQDSLNTQTVLHLNLSPFSLIGYMINNTSL